MTDHNTVLELKDALRNTTAPRLGKFGEKIYKHLMVEKGHIQSSCVMRLIGIRAGRTQLKLRLILK